MRVWLRRYWPVLFSFGISTHAVYAARTSTPLDAANLGQFVAGYAGALAFVWLVAGYYLQSEELKLQRQELRSQREALDLQKAELHRMAVHGALAQVATMVMDFRNRLPEHGIPNLASYEEIGHQLMRQRDDLRTAVYYQGVDDIINSYTTWRRIEGIALRFLMTIKMGAEVYARDAGGVTIQEDQDPVQFVIKNEMTLRSLPHVAECMYAGYVIASVLERLRPYRTRAAQRYEQAVSTRFGGTVGDTELATALESMVRDFERANPL